MTTHRADVEGLRGVAIAAVIAYHARVGVCGGGYIGVDVFFAISGYLITGILLREFSSTRDVDMVAFYARRFRRLSPALLAALALTAVASLVAFAPMEQSRQLSAAAIASSTYMGNIYFAYGAIDYLSPGANGNPFLHFWSLGLEEQFYILWPTLLFAILRLLKRVPKASSSLDSSPPRAAGAALAIVAIASFAACVTLTREVQPWAFFLLPARAWEFALGGILWFIPSPRGRAAEVVAILGASAIAISLVCFDASTPFPGFAALFPCGGAATILWVGRTASPWVNRGLGARPMRFLGRISYSLYLVHWPIFVVVFQFSAPITPLPQIVAIFASLLIAIMLHYVVEAPLRQARPLTAHRVIILLAVMACVVCAAAGLGWRLWAAERALQPDQRRYMQARTTLSDRGCVPADFLDDNARPSCHIAPATPRRQVVLVGDSHAAHWLPALRLAANEAGWDVTVYAKSACPFADVHFVHPTLGREFRECTSWRQDVIALLTAHPPDLVIIANSRGVLNDGINLTPKAWSNALQSTLQSLSRSKVVVLQDNPAPGFDVPACLARAAWAPSLSARASCDFEWKLDDVIDKAERAAATATAASVVNIDDLVCEAGHCDAERDGNVVFRDGNHLAATFADATAQRFWERLRDAVR